MIPLWLWDQVTLDCHGALEPKPIVYRVQERGKHITGTVVQPDGSIGFLYSLDPWHEFARTDGLNVNWDPPVAVGEAAYLDPVAVDQSGNRSDGVCR